MKTSEAVMEKVAKRLMANLREVVRVLQKFGEIELTPEVEKKLARMSAAAV